MASETASRPADLARSYLARSYLEHAPAPMAAVKGATHLVRYMNPAFRRLIDKAEADVVGTCFCELMPGSGECVSLLDTVYRTGKSATYTALGHGDDGARLLSYVMWPVFDDDQTVGAVIQVIPAASLHEQTLEMNEALLLGSLRQHELTEAADWSNARLKTEIGERKQRERDALMLTHEIAHRIKNNLLIISALIANEVRRTPAQYAQGYEAMQARIGAIADLYDLISQSSHGEAVSLDAYLREIATAMSQSLLGDTSGIVIVVEAEALELDPDRAVPFGLIVNELGTNAIKHAFPDGVGRVTLAVRRIDDQIELTVADDGRGMILKNQAALPGRHGSDYVAIFVRQLGGTMEVSGADGSGTIVRIRLPLLGTRSPVLATAEQS